MLRLIKLWLKAPIEEHVLCSPLTASWTHGSLAARAPGWTSLDQGFAYSSKLARVDLVKSLSRRRLNRAEKPNKLHPFICCWMSKIAGATVVGQGICQRPYD